MRLFHGTSERNKSSIIEDGFKAGYGEYGTGVYFATTKDFAWDYGDEIVEAFVDDEYIKKVSLEEIEDIKANMECNDLADYFYNFYNFENENLVHAIMIDIDFGKGIEICVYDTSIIEIL